MSLGLIAQSYIADENDEDEKELSFCYFSQHIQNDASSLQEEQNQLTLADSVCTEISDQTGAFQDGIEVKKNVNIDKNHGHHTIPAISLLEQGDVEEKEIQKEDKSLKHFTSESSTDAEDIENFLQVATETEIIEAAFSELRGEEKADNYEEEKSQQRLTDSDELEVELQQTWPFTHCKIVFNYNDTISSGSINRVRWTKTGEKYFCHDVITKEDLEKLREEVQSVGGRSRTTFRSLPEEEVAEIKEAIRQRNQNGRCNKGEERCCLSSRSHQKTEGSHPRNKSIAKPASKKRLHEKHVNATTGVIRSTKNGDFYTTLNSLANFNGDSLIPASPIGKPISNRVRIQIRAEFKCPYCFVAFEEPSELISHLGLHESNNFRKVEPSYVPGTTNEMNTKAIDLALLEPKIEIKEEHDFYPSEVESARWPCVICGQNFSRTYDLYNHMDVHTGDKPFKCPLCDLRFQQLSDVESHVRVVHDVGKETSLLQLLEGSKKVKKRNVSQINGVVRIQVESFNNDSDGSRFFNDSVFESSYDKDNSQARDSDVYPCNNLQQRPGIITHSDSKLNTRSTSSTSENKTNNRTRKAVRFNFADDAIFDNCPSPTNDTWDYDVLVESMFTEVLVDKKRTFECRKCPRICPDRSKAIRHTIVHSNLRPFKCNRCHKTFRFAASLKRHARGHYSKGKTNNFLKCGSCNLHFDTIFNVRKHESIHTEISFECEICHKRFRTKYHLKRHKLTHKRKRTAPTEVYNQPLTSYRSLVMHPKQNLKEESPIRTIAHPSMDSFSDNIIGSSLQTNILKSSNKNLSRHNIQMHGGAFNCPYCGKTFSNRYNVGRHIRRIHHGPVFREKTKSLRCTQAAENTNLCASQSKTKRTVRKKTSIVKTLKCGKCTSRFYSREYLRRHMKIHSEDNPNICQICGKKFGEAYRLHRHMNVHAENGSFKCQECNAQFKFKSSLTRHEEDAHSLLYRLSAK